MRKRRKLLQRSSLIWTKSSATGSWCRSLPDGRATSDARCSERRSDARAQARRLGGADRFIGCEAQIFGRKEQV